MVALTTDKKQRRAVESVHMNGRAIRKELRDGRRVTPRYLLAEKKVMRVARWIVSEVRRKMTTGENMNLYLANDVIAADTGLTVSVVKKAKEKLSAAGVIYIPAGGRQTGEGTYPLWFLDLDYVDIEYAEAPRPTPKRKHWARGMGDTVSAMYDKIKTAHREALIDAGVTEYPLKSFMMKVNRDLSQWIRAQETTWSMV